MSDPNPNRLDPTRSAQVLRAVIESAPTAMVMVDPLGRIVLLNAETEKLFGYERDELLGQIVEVLVPERFRAGHPRSRVEYFDRPQARRMGAGRDLYALRKDGSEFPVEIGLNPVVTDEGTFVLSAVVDISERQRMEQEQRLLSSLVESVEDYAIFMLDLNGIVTTWNVGAERIKGYRADEIIGRHFACFYAPEDLEQRRPEKELATARAAGRHAAEAWRIRRDGSRFWAHVTFTALHDRSGALIGYSKITRDLTEQRRAERRFRATIESSPTAMVMIEPRGRIVLLNAETEKLFGYGRDELLQASVEVLLPERFRARHPKLREAFFARPEARPMGAGRDLFGLRKDGSEFPIEIGLSPVETDEGLFVLSAIVDITERKRLEESQRRLNQQLEQSVDERTEELEVARDAAQTANRAKTEFLANMSHEIRTPLNAVIGLTEALLRTALSEAQRDHLRTVMDSGEALLNVINDILDFAKIEAGKLSVERVPFDLHDVVADTLRSQAIRAQQKGIDLACFVDPRLPSARIGDPIRLRQVITNLVGNAIKFTDDGEVVVRVEREGAERHAPDPGDWLRFSVRDTGVGIDPAELDRLFLPFEQADSSTTRQHGGTGLGLSISRQLVEMMGGRIGAVSRPGEGSTFHFTVNVEVPAALRGAGPRRAPGLAGTAVLIVDDRSASRDVLAEILLTWGMRPVAAASVEEAFAELERAWVAGDPFGIALADVDMPDRGGLALAERIRRDDRFDELEIVLLVSAEPTGAPHRSGEHRAAARLKKPVKQSELRRAIARALGSEGFEDLGDRLRQEVRATGGRPIPDSAEVSVAPQRILLVEDSVANQKVAGAILAGHGHTIVVAANGREALDALAEEDFDLVLMDVQMPEMDGFEATAAIRAGESAMGRRLPIIAMTAHALPGDREKCLAAGMDDYVVKPIRRAELFRALARVKGLAPGAD